MADTSYWSRLPAGASIPNYAVYRYPNQSPDGTQFLATNCGNATTACTSGSSIFQDVNISAYVGRTFSYGGKVTADGSAGTSALVTWQLDANYNVLRQDTMNLTVPIPYQYQSYTSQTITIAANAKTLRYQFYHGTNSISYFLANMFVNLN
jgi:hypothetical protein